MQLSSNAPVPKGSALVSKQRAIVQWRFLSLLLLLSSLSAVVNLSAQILPYDAGNSGQHYVIAFPDTASNADPGGTENIAASFYLYLYSAVQTSVQITYPSASSRSFSLTAGEFALIDLTPDRGVVTTTVGSPARGAYIVEAASPIIAYCYMATPFGADGWTPIPVENWGTDYVAATLPGEVISDVRRSGFLLNQSPAKAPADILIIAAYDGTSVSIEPTAPLSSNAPRNVLLNAGEVYQVQSSVDTTEEGVTQTQTSLAGSTIHASRPIGVITGNTRTIVLDGAEGISRNSLKNAMYEWLAPIETHGTQFVYTPTWDSRRITGGAGEEQSGKRSAEFAYVYGTSSGKTDGTYQDVFSAGEERFSVQEGEFYTQRISGEARAGFLKTNKPSQIYMASTPISTLIESQTGFGGVITRLEYEGWGAYMTELVPVEQWTSFAPFIAPPNPGNLEHFVNVITRASDVDSIRIKIGDGTEQPFGFNRGKIPGTNYVWGTTSILPGTTYYLRGKSGKRFAATIYGVSKGFETYSRVPARYDEQVGLAYGYPAAPNRFVVGPADSLLITTKRACEKLNVSVVDLSLPAARLRSISLDPQSQNSMIEVVSPPSGVVNGSTAVEFNVRPINVEKDASAQVLISDRTGAQKIVRYSYEAERMGRFPTADTVRFDPVTIGFEGKDTTILLVNEGDSSFVISSVTLTNADKAFSIQTEKPIPLTLAPGESLRIVVKYTPKGAGGASEGVLTVAYGCARERQFQLRGTTLLPCLNALGYAFERTEINSRAQGAISLTNTGIGELKFSDDVNNLVTGLENGFSIPQSELDGLAGAILGSGESRIVLLEFISDQPGSYETTIYFNTNSPEECPRGAKSTIAIYAPDSTDTTTSVPLDFLGGKNSHNHFSVAIPNPLVNQTRLEFNVGTEDDVTLDIFNSVGQFVERIVDETLKSGTYRTTWNPVGYASGVYYLRLTIGEWNETQRVMIRKDR
ncbi:MAG: T9SS type A sorting domain-containing protein [Ignavibacteriae bacterium]|nr:T9SS type A sorting domain-containing protein [Ignavibacteriota bacterium]MCB9215992.1 T9SS type A sorting domain-containing protein [Ignavibacteria bacterium]